MNNSALEKRKGLVLSVSEINGSDGRIILLNDQGVFYVRARGIFKSESRNRRLAIPGSLIELDYDPRYSIRDLFLIHGSVLESAPDFSGSLINNALYGWLCDLLEKNGGIIDGFEMYTQLVQDLKKNERALICLDACMILAAFIRDQGLMPVIDQCSGCGSRSSIHGLSFEQGGLICRKCFNPEMDLSLNRERLLKFISVFKKDFKNRKILLEKFQYDFKDVELLADWLGWNQGNPSASERFFRTAVSMSSDR